MTTAEIAERFLAFFQERDHLVARSSSLVPENDPSVLFTTAGMQQFKGYYLKPETAPKRRIASVQPCLRTVDIDEVGDETHATLFEMLGNFSFGFAGKTEADGSYFKREAIDYAWTFLTDSKAGLGITPDRIYATYFIGDEQTPADDESPQLLAEITGLPPDRIRGLGRDEVFWGPTGNEGPCGPTVEFYVDGIEIWNNVFNEYYFRDGHFQPLEQKGVDTGMGLERLAKILQQVDSIYYIDTNEAILTVIDHIVSAATSQRSRRILVDHLKASAFLIADGVRPSNKEQGYVLRRLIRRVIREALRANSSLIGWGMIFAEIINQYGNRYRYPKLQEESRTIVDVFMEEHQKFSHSLQRGLRELEKRRQDGNEDLGQLAFFLFESYGFPLEMTREELRDREVVFDEEQLEQVFQERLLAHQNISKSRLEQKFKGGLAGHSDQEIRYHTATHLLNAALRKVLGDHVWQKGSNITPDRLRFDFSHPAKTTDDERIKIEQLVNAWIAADLPVVKKMMAKEQAKASGAIGVFDEKYGDEVSVYEIGRSDEVVSRELCGGPHVQRTGMIGQLKITKEEASSAGVRRLKAIVEPSTVPLTSI